MIFIFLQECLVTYSVCHIPGGSSHGSGQRCPHSCCWCGRRSVRAAGCLGHKSQNSGSIQTRGTNHPRFGLSLLGGRHKILLPLRISHKDRISAESFKKKLTWITTRAALSVGHGGVGTWDQRAGDFATHSSRVLDGGISTRIMSELTGWLSTGAAPSLIGVF